jgi:hypothetical protein
LLNSLVEQLVALPDTIKYLGLITGIIMSVGGALGIIVSRVNRS